MSTDTKIEWTHPPGFRGATWNPTRGCRKLSAGCKHCYAATFAERWRGIAGHAYERGFEPRTVPESLDLPLRTKAPTCWFVDSMSDLFLEYFPDEYIAAVFGVMAAAPRHRFLVLTKRAERMRRWFEWIARHAAGSSTTPVAAGVHYGQLATNHTALRAVADGAWWTWPLPNVWLGCSVEDQATADARIPHLLATPAAVRFVSYEPALGPVDFRRIDHTAAMYGPGAMVLDGSARPHLDALGGYVDNGEHRRLDWLIVGGESGPGARPFDVAWARSVVEQCKAAGVPVFFKQAGRHPYTTDARDRGMPGARVQMRSPNGLWFNAGISIEKPERWSLKMRSPKGGDPAEWPEDLRVREFPAVQP